MVVELENDTDFADHVSRGCCRYVVHYGPNGPNEDERADVLPGNSRVLP